MNDGQLRITNDGMLSIDDYRSIHRAILISLKDHSQKMFDLINKIRRTFHEFKFIKIELIVEALSELIRLNLISSSYEWVV